METEEWVKNLDGKAWACSSCKWVQGGHRGEGPDVRTKLESEFLTGEDKY